MGFTGFTLESKQSIGGFLMGLSQMRPWGNSLRTFWGKFLAIFSTLGICRIWYPGGHIATLSWQNPTPQTVRERQLQPLELWHQSPSIMSIRPLPSYNNPGFTILETYQSSQNSENFSHRPFSCCCCFVSCLKNSLCFFCDPSKPQKSRPRLQWLCDLLGVLRFLRKREGKYRVTNYLDVPLEVRINVEKK